MKLKRCIWRGRLFQGHRNEVNGYTKLSTRPTAVLTDLRHGWLRGASHRNMVLIMNCGEDDYSSSGTTCSSTSRLFIGPPMGRKPRRSLHGQDSQLKIKMPREITEVHLWIKAGLTNMVPEVSHGCGRHGKVEADNSLFICRKSDQVVLILLYVDDIIVTVSLQYTVHQIHIAQGIQYEYIEVLSGHWDW